MDRISEYADGFSVDNGSTKTGLLEITARLIDAVASSYSIDKTRLYATGQSMSCMTMLYLTANHPDLFAAEMFVDGQWDTNDLPNFSSQKFCYFTAGGDAKASQGQVDVEALLTANNVPYATTTIDATWSSDQINTTAQAMLNEGETCNSPSWTADSVITANPGKNMEHMASFGLAYKVDTVDTARDRLYR